MKIKFDSAIFCNQRFGGISRYFFELSNEINALNRNDDLKIVAPLYKNEYIRESKFTKGYYWGEYPKYTNQLYRYLNYFIDKTQIQETDLEQQILSYFATKDDKSLILRVEEGVPIEKAVNVLDIANRNQIKVVLAVRPK